MGAAARHVPRRVQETAPPLGHRTRVRAQRASNAEAVTAGRRRDERMRRVVADESQRTVQGCPFRVLASQTMTRHARSSAGFPKPECEILKRKAVDIACDTESTPSAARPPSDPHKGAGRSLHLRQDRALRRFCLAFVEVHREPFWIT